MHMRVIFLGPFFVFQFPVPCLHDLRTALTRFFWLSEAHGRELQLDCARKTDVASVFMRGALLMTLSRPPTIAHTMWEEGMLFLELYKSPQILSVRLRLVLKVSIMFNKT